jgi:hygromycin-B 4-O-kinase
MAKTRFLLTDVRAFLDTRFSSVTGLVSLTEGEESQAFAFDAGAPFVLRINRDGTGFAKDRLALEHFGALLPVPEIMLIAPFGDAVACVSRRAPGVTLQDLTKDAAMAAAPAVARVMKALRHADIRAFSGAGPFDAERQGSHPHWADWIADIGAKDWTGIEGAGPALETVLRFAGTCPDVKGLVHGDFGSNNALCADAQITGVIDWSEAMIGDPLYDLANILFWRSWLTCMEVQAAFLERAYPQWFADSDRLTAYRLRIGLDTLWHAERDGDPRLATWARARLAEAL